jgi:menaquinone-9 beta-reductase
MLSEVVVVGGGPAGSACALVLARAGIGVTVVERSVFPRRKACGEYLNAGAVAALDTLGLGDSVRAKANPLAGIRLVPPALEPLDLDFSSAAYALPRATLDALLLDAACAAGARSVTARAEDLLFTDDRVSGVSVREPSGELRTLRARYVVGADGIGSLVARKLGLARPIYGARRFALGGHYAGFGDMEARIEMYVGRDAYFALNPLDADATNVMVVVREGQLASWSSAIDDGMRGKAAELARGRRSFEGAQRLGPRITVGPLDFRVADVSRPGALLAGDAAGFLNPFTGQGVSLALGGGTDAGETLVRALAEPVREADVCRAYAVRRAKQLAARRRISAALDLMLDVPPLAARAASRLRRMPELGRALLDLMSGAPATERRLSPLLLGRLLW